MQQNSITHHAERLYSPSLKTTVSGSTDRAFLQAAAMFFGKRAARALLTRRSLRGADRQVQVVRSAYDEARKETFEQLADMTLEEFLFGTVSDCDFSLVQNRIVYRSQRDASNDLRTTVRQTVESSRRGGTIVEVGAGGGQNLLYLRQSVDNRLVGLELSPESVTLARAASEKFALPVEFETCDVSAELSLIPNVDVVFTCHALEMMPRVFVSALANIVKLKARTVIFFEPVEETWPYDLRGLISRLRVRNLDRLSGFMHEARRHFGEPIRVQALPTTPNALNQTAVIIFRGNA